MVVYFGARTLVVIVLGSCIAVLLFYNTGKVNQAALSAENGTTTRLYARGSSEAGDTERNSLRPNGPHGSGIRNRPDPTQLRLNASTTAKTTIRERENRLADEALDNSKTQWGNGRRNDGINNSVDTSTNNFGQELQPVDRCSEEYSRFGGSSQISARNIGCEECEERECAIYDLRNVAVQGDVLHVYAPGAETRDKLEQWKNRLPALTYTWGGIAEDGKQIEIHTEPLHESICHARSHGVSFYLVPHFQENAFHLHNDNIMPMTASILSTPCLCSGEELESCTQLRKNLIQTPRKKQKHGYIHSEFLEIFESMFDYQSKVDRGIYGTRLAPTEETGRLHCLDHMVWGYPKPYYVNCAAARASAALAWQHFTLQKLGIQAPASMTPVEPSPAKDAKPRVLFLRRTAVQSGPEKTRRFMPDRSSLQRAWMDVGIHMKEWIYTPNANLKSIIGSLAGFDIYLGVHGAQLTNILYGTPGLVLVEVQNPMCVKDMFRQVANSMNGGYVRVNTKYSSHFQLNDDTAAAVVRCALALWRRDDSSICEDSMSTGPSQCPETGPGRHGEDIEGIVYYEKVGQHKC